MDLPIGKLIKLAKMAGVMHEADHTLQYLEHLVIGSISYDVPFIACVINLPCIFTYYLELSNF